MWTTRCTALDGHRKRPVPPFPPFNNYLGPNRPVQMSKALGISGFAFHNAVETERLTKPDCSKFHTMELHFSSLTHQHCHPDRPGHCFGQASRALCKDIKTYRQRTMAGCWPPGSSPCRSQWGCPEKCFCLSQPLPGRSKLCNQVYKSRNWWHQLPLYCLTSLPAPQTPETTHDLDTNSLQHNTSHSTNTHSCWNDSQPHSKQQHCFNHRCDWQRTKKQKNINLHFNSLYIYFVPLLASANKEIVRPTRPKFLEQCFP